MEHIRKILAALGAEYDVTAAEAFRAEEDGRPYAVWKLDTSSGPMVLKRTTEQEEAVYKTFFPEGGPVPQIYASGEFEGERYLLMEYVARTSMSRCTRRRLIRTLDALIETQKRYWDCTEYEDVGYGFRQSWPNRCRRLEHMGDLTDAYRAYLDAFASVPRTLCNDDLLPFNVLADDDRAVMIDWEYGGILPYPSALARLLAFGEEEEGQMFYMTGEDRQFALDYYYDHLVREKGISRAEFDRTMDLFFLKEYSEWVYCAALENDFEMEYYKKYVLLARKLAEKLGFQTEKGGTVCFA